MSKKEEYKDRIIVLRLEFTAVHVIIESLISILKISNQVKAKPTAYVIQTIITNIEKQIKEHKGHESFSAFENEGELK